MPRVNGQNRPNPDGPVPWSRAWWEVARWLHRDDFSKHDQPVSTVGVVLREAMSRVGIRTRTQTDNFEAHDLKELADSLGVEPILAAALLDDTATVTQEQAWEFQDRTGITASWWLSLRKVPA